MRATFRPRLNPRAALSAHDLVKRAGSALVGSIMLVEGPAIKDGS